MMKGDGMDISSVYGVLLLLLLLLLLQQIRCWLINLSRRRDQ